MDGEATGVVAQSGAGGPAGVNMRPILLDMPGGIGHMRARADVDLVVVEISAGGEQAGAVGARVLRIGPFLQTGIVLLDSVASDGILQEEGEIGEEVEKRPADEAGGLESLAAGSVL